MMTPVNPSSDPINQGNDSRRRSLPERFICPITRLVMIDPVLLPISEEIVDRWSLFQSLHGDTGPSPYTRQPITVSALSSIKPLRKEIDRHLAPATIQERERYRQAIRHAAFQKEMEIPLDDWQCTPLEMFTLISTHADKIKSLFRQSRCTWEELLAVPIERLKILLDHDVALQALINRKYLHYTDLLKVPGTAIESLMQIPDSAFQFMLEIKEACDWREFSDEQWQWLFSRIEKIFQLKQILQTADVNLVSPLRIFLQNLISCPNADATIDILLQSSSDELEFISETKHWLSWYKLSAETLTFLSTHQRRLTKLKESLENLDNNFIINHFDILQELIKHPGIIEWSSEKTPRLYPKHILQSLIDIQIELGTQAQDTTLMSNVDIVKNKLLKQEERMQIAQQFAIWYADQFHCQESLDLMSKIRSSRNRRPRGYSWEGDFFLCSRTDQEKMEFEDMVMWPLIQGSVKYHIVLIPLRCDEDRTYIFFEGKCLSCIQIDFYLNRREIATAYVNTLIKFAKHVHDIFSDGVPQYCHGLFTRKYEIFGAHLNYMLRELLYKYSKYSNIVAHGHTKNKEISILFIRSALKSLFTAEAYRLRAYPSKFTSDVLVNFYDSFFKKNIIELEKEFSDDSSPLLTMQSMIEKRVIRNFRARLYGVLPAIVFIIELLLMLAFPPLLLFAIVLHCCNKEKYPIFWLPPSYIVKTARTWKQDIEKWCVFYDLYNASDAPERDAQTENLAESFIYRDPKFFSSDIQSCHTNLKSDFKK